MPYVIRGVIGLNRSNASRAGEFTYLAETGDHFYIWDGVRKAAHFGTAEAGFRAAGSLASDWERTKGKSRMTWEHAKSATRAGWDRIAD